MSFFVSLLFLFDRSRNIQALVVLTMSYSERFFFIQVSLQSVRVLLMRAVCCKGECNCLMKVILPYCTKTCNL